MKHVKLFGGSSPPPKKRPKPQKKPKAPDGQKPGDRYSQAEARAYRRLRDLGGTKTSPDDWERVAKSLREEDPRACACAFLIGGRHARTLKRYEMGNRLAQESGKTECSFEWTPGIDPDYPIEES